MPPSVPERSVVSDEAAVLADRKYLGEKLLYAERRGAELADEFTRLEVQISAILIGFLGVFASRLGDVVALEYIYTISITCLLISLIAGLLHIKRKEIWWDDCHIERVGMIEIWNKVIDGNLKLDYARESLKAIRAIKSGGIIRSPKWTWILQTIFLGIGVILLIVLFLIVVFSPVVPVV